MIFPWVHSGENFVDPRILTPNLVPFMYIKYKVRIMYFIGTLSWKGYRLYTWPLILIILIGFRRSTIFQLESGSISFYKKKEEPDLKFNFKLKKQRQYFFKNPYGLIKNISQGWSWTIRFILLSCWYQFYYLSTISCQSLLPVHSQ